MSHHPGTAMNANLFVYGTLMSTAGHPKGTRLAREGRLIGPASLQGRLYRIKWYPGLVETGSVAERVHGELYQLADPLSSLAWLDAYEGLVPGGLHDNEYARIERPVRLDDGSEHTAWVYVYCGSTDPLSHIAGGRWLGAAK